MRFLLLGPLAVVSDRGVTPLGATRHQKVLARLALDANRLVPLDAIVDAVWQDPPASAPRIVRNAVSDLRTRWAKVGVPEPDAVIVTDGPGYLLRTDPGMLDTVQFLRLSEQARGAPGKARELLRAALDLWRGPFLGALTGQVFAAAATRWHEERLAVWEWLTRLELSLGRHRALIGELSELITEHPYREELVGHLMLALHRSGRAAEATGIYHQLRQRLATGLGIDPDPRLQRLHTAILRRDTTVELTPVSPRTLPVWPRWGPS